MIARLRSWWQKIQQHSLITAGIIASLVGVVTLIVVIYLGYRYGWNWVGVNGGYDKITITPQGTNREQPTGKTLWDWLQLLFIPALLSIGAIWFTARHNHDREIAGDNQRETQMQVYLDRMTDLLLNQHLRNSQPEEEVRKIARIRTLTVLYGLDSMRKRSVLQFLYESGLIYKGSRIVNLSGADLWQADLKKIYLKDAHLGGTLCWKVDFSGADLRGADLGGVFLREVFFNGTNLSGADLSGANFLDADGKSRKVTPDIIIAELEKQGAIIDGIIYP